MNFANIDFQYILLGLVSFIIAGTIHEYSHALSAYILGDETARLNGRMTFNPLPHIDIWGTLVFPLFGAISNLPIIGWMKPVPVNPLNFRKPSRDDAICALAGPFSNLFQASFVLIIIKLFLMIIPLKVLVSNIVLETIYRFLSIYFSTNICLMIFNLFPVPPLDGSWILRHFLPDEWKEKFDRLSRFGFIILYLLIVINAFDYVFVPLYNTASSLAVSLLKMNIILVSLPFIALSGITLYFLREEVSLFIHRIKHRSTLTILKGEKGVPDSEPAISDYNDTSYNTHSDEYIKEKEARIVWKNCDKTRFDKHKEACIKCDKYVSCLVQSSKESSST